ncbi:MAG: PP2C family protein-serine/threonine phosphatase, partial [bacterium]
GASFLAPITLNGRLLGLFVLGEKLSEDHFRVEDIELLEAAASQTAVALENANLHKNLQDQERLKNEMQLAQKIQLGSLPKKVPDVPGLEIFATSKPASEVGGDYYDFLKYNDQQFMTIVGDVSGKGTSAALYVAKIQGIMRSIYEYHPSPADLFAKLNDVLRGDIEKNYFITQVGVKFDLQKRMATLARAGHEPVLYYNSKEQTVHFMESNGLGLCLGSPDEFKQQLQEITVPFNSGDYFILFTDGITDARDQQDHEFGEKRLLETLKKTDNGTAEQIGNGIINRVKEFTTGAQRFDDMTVCVVKVK